MSSESSLVYGVPGHLVQLLKEAQTRRREKKMARPPRMFPSVFDLVGYTVRPPASAPLKEWVVNPLEENSKTIHLNIKDFAVHVIFTTG